MPSSPPTPPQPPVPPMSTEVQLLGQILQEIRNLNSNTIRASDNWYARDLTYADTLSHSENIVNDSGQRFTCNHIMLITPAGNSGYVYIKKSPPGQEIGIPAGKELSPMDGIRTDRIYIRLASANDHLIIVAW